MRRVRRLLMVIDPAMDKALSWACRHDKAILRSASSITLNIDVTVTS
jgi:hypothetical protein